MQAFKELGKAGWFSLLIPKEYGGMGLTLKEHAEVCMALAESSASAGFCYMMSNVAVNCLNLFGSYQLKQKIFSDIVQNKTFAALAYSELGTGTHFYSSFYINMAWNLVKIM
ncbi:acyl-CoA/acyl-ACP dehydrogenase [Haemophilus influenzae]|uniref:acyl-CoA dehydrogenase family protein n=1 Tax=Haemophilus influenzae TaxID=727 RepID=UPI001EFBFCF4|nr:acyl-CoA dehydrogenase family protein [Haemophilus influenzae]